jgi:hypothetical protein
MRRWRVSADEARALALSWWGKRLAAIRVNLPLADTSLVEALLAEAWQRRA